MKKMETKSSFFLFLLLSLLILFPSLPVFAELAWAVTYKIEVHTNGSATWTIEHSALLETENDVTLFFQYSGSNKFEEFKENVTSLVNEAWLRIGRDMGATNFGMDAGIYYEVTGTHGIVKYRFDWIGFAEVEDDRVEIGDVFDGEYISLHQGDVLIIEYPVGYAVLLESTTEPDANKEHDRELVWYGPRNFGVREPMVTFEKTTSTIIDIINQYLLAIISVIVLAGIGTSLWFFRFRGKEEKRVGDYLAKIAIETEEEKIVMLLRTAGGRLPQSTIIQQLGFSKSKTSKILKNLENKGIVKREMIGKRRKTVTLTDEVKESKK